jgi:uncharacterized repeat protein (TIGR01451 family)
MNTKLIFLVLVLQTTLLKAQLTYSGVNQIGGNAGQGGKAVSIDPFNNMVVAGSTFSNTEFSDASGTQTTIGIGEYDIYAEKLDPGGNILWAKQLGGAGLDLLESVTTDLLGNIYLAGFFNDTIRLEGVDTLQTDTDNWDIFLIKLDPNGQPLWAHSFGGALKDEAHAVATDQQGNVYLTGFYRDTIDFDPGPGVFTMAGNSSGTETMFILKLNPDGNFTWVKHMTSGTNHGLSVGKTLLVKNGHLYAGGYFSGKVDFNPNAGVMEFTSQFDDGFVQKFNMFGGLIWTMPVAGNLSERVLAITVDDQDNVISTGYFSGSIDLDPGVGTTSFTSAGNHDVFFQKVNASGQFIFGKKVGGTTQDQGWGITTDKAGNVYTIGLFGATVDFDPGAMTQNRTANGFSDAFVLKLDKNGNFANVASWGASQSDFGYGITLNQEESLVLIGTFNQTVDFDPGPDTAALVANGFDGYVLRMLQPWDYTGIVYHDVNENNQRDAGEPGLSGVLVEAVDRLAYASTDAAGEYHLFYNLDGDALRVIPKRPYWQINPPLLPMDTTQSGHITAVIIPEAPDVCLFITEERPFVSGFPTAFQVQVSNVGTVPVYDLPVLLRISEQPTGGAFMFLEANIPPQSQTAETFHWRIDTLDVEQTITYRIWFLTPATAELGSNFTFSAGVEFDSDVDQSNNTRRFRNQIFSSYDPNDKQVFPDKASTVAADTTTLDYLIRFQNTGNFPATFVILRDTLSSDLDLATLQIMGASHPFTWRIYGNRILEFRFDDINLPDSTSNEPESHGFAAFAIQPVKGLASGDKVYNRAGIYFDFNAPVITNDAVFSVSNLVANHTPADPINLALAPNPAAVNSPIRLELPRSTTLPAQVRLTDLTGKTLLAREMGTYVLLLPGLPAGTYQVQVVSDGKSGVKTLMVR